MRSIKFLFVTAALIVCGLCSAAVNIPMDNSWRAMKHTRHARCVVLSDGLEVTNPNRERDYAAVNNKITVDLSANTTIAVVRDNGNPPASDIVSPPTGVSAASVALAAATVALFGAAVVLSKKLRAGA